MPLNLSIKNVPDDLAQLLRERAARTHRSLQRELLALLEHAVATGGTEVATGIRRPTLSIEEAVARARLLFPDGTPSSVDFIRQLRDQRTGAA